VKAVGHRMGRALPEVDLRAVLAGGLVSPRWDCSTYGAYRLPVLQAARNGLHPGLAFHAVPGPRDPRRVRGDLPGIRARLLRAARRAPGVRTATLICIL
jgi:hypothetical protein